MNPNEIDVSKTPDIPSISHDNDMDREFYETYFQETMSMRRRTRSMTRSHTTTSSDGVPIDRIRRQRPRRDDERSSCNRRITRSSTFASLPPNDQDNVNGIEEAIHTNYDDLTDEEPVLMSSTNTESDDEDGDRDEDEI